MRRALELATTTMTMGWMQGWMVPPLLPGQPGLPAWTVQGWARCTRRPFQLFASWLTEKCRKAEQKCKHGWTEMVMVMKEGLFLSLSLPLSHSLACIVYVCVCEGPGPKGFPCYACDVCLTLSLACPGSTGCKQHPNDWPLSRHRTRSFVLYPLALPPSTPSLPLCLSLCTLSGCTRMVSFTFYVRMLLFFELWRQEHREREREG